MSYAVLALIIFGSAGAAVVASALVDRTLAVEQRRRHHEVGGPVFAQAGVMVSVLLAFVFSEVWGEYRTAALAINSECGALHGAAMLAGALPDGLGRPVNRAIAGYANTVITVEWPTMADRRRSPAAALDFQTALRAAVAIPATRPTDVSTAAQIVSLLTVAHAARETRTFQIDQGLPAIIWAMLIAMSLMLIGCVVMAGIDRAGHLLFAGAFTGCIVLVLLLVRILDYPFEGALALQSTDFVKVRGEVTVLAQ